MSQSHMLRLRPRQRVIRWIEDSIEITGQTRHGALGFKANQADMVRSLGEFTVYDGSPYCMHAQSCLTLCDPMDCSPPGSSVLGIFQARILELIAISSSRGSSRLRDRICVSCIGRQILYS